MNHRIAMVTSLHKSGDVRIYHKLSKTLARAGWRVELINPEFEGADSDGIRFKRVTQPESRIARMARSRSLIFEALKASRADICTFHDPELLPLAEKVKSGLFMRVTYDAHEDIALQIQSKSWLPHFLRARYAGEALLAKYLPILDGATAATEGIARGLSAFNDNVAVVRNRPTAEDTIMYDVALRNTQRIPRAVCYAGAITEQRGVFEMIRCCHEAGAILMLAGSFESDSLRTRAEKMPEYSCVRYLGQLGRRETAGLYAASNAGLLLLHDTPAYRESEPIKLFEYLCAGLPVIASDFDHWRDITPSAPMCFVPCKDTAAAAEAVARAIKAPVRHEVSAMRLGCVFEPDAKALLKFYEGIEQKGRDAR